MAVTITLIEESGIAAVSARAVARAANVPVGSVSYYFESVHQLLLEASRAVVARRVARLKEWEQTVTAATVLDQLVDLIHEQVTTGRALTVVAYELYILGLRDSAFAEVSQTSLPALRSCLQHFMPPAQAATLAATADGLQLESLFAHQPPTRSGLRATLRATL